MTARSFTVGGLDCFVKNFPTIKIIPAIKWVQSASGFYFGSDRGAAQDVFEIDVTFYDTEANINTLQTTLNSSRGNVVMTNFGDSLFSPYVDHSGTINAVFSPLGMRKYTAFASPSTGMYEMPATIRAVSPPVLTSSPSLSKLRLQYGFTADKTYSSNKLFTYSQTAIIEDENSDNGVFKASFLQFKAEAQAILAYFLNTQRASSFAFPSIGVTYPFGIVIGALPLNTNLISFKVTRQDFEFYKIDTVWSQAK